MRLKLGELQDRGIIGNVEVAAALNGLDVPTSTGGKWTPDAVGKLKKRL